MWNLPASWPGVFNHMYGREPGFEERPRRSESLAPSVPSFTRSSAPGSSRMAMKRAWRSARLCFEEAQNLSLGIGSALYGYPSKAVAR